MNIDQFKKQARDKFTVEAENKHLNPISFLYTQDWNVPTGLPFPELELAKMNINLDARGCFGRAVRAAVLAEQFFPDKMFFAGEVRDDLFRDVMLKTASPDDWKDESYITEILQYEDPHFVLVHGQSQFDPAFKSYSDEPEYLKHPSVQTYGLWMGLYAGYLISEGLVLFKEDQDPEGFLRVLKAAEQICPDLLLIQENMVSAYGAIGDFDRAEEILQSIYGKRKDARILLALYIFTENDHFKQQIINEYSIHMFNYLKQRYSL